MTDEEYMQLALNLASATKGQTSPNPVVGAIVVKNGKVIGMGAHLKRGEAHAEVIALQMAGNEAENADVYVTLEPCSHYGKTPPCAELLIEKRVKRVVIATEDPNEQVSGQGIEKLKQAGIQVETGILQEKAEWLNRHFFHYIRTGQPYVTLKTAASLDGKTATRTGESKWITGEAARLAGHDLRHTHDAILVGVETVMADDPSLTVRRPNGGIHPIRVIVDRHLRTPLSSKMIQDKEAPVWILCTKEADEEKKRQLENRGVQVFSFPSINIDVRDVLTFLGKKEITSLYVEGGATVHASFVENHLFQEIVCFIAPKIIGGRDAPSVIGGEGIASMEEITSLDIVSLDRVGEDIQIVAIPKKKGRT